MYSVTITTTNTEWTANSWSHTTNNNSINDIIQWNNAAISTIFNMVSNSIAGKSFCTIISSILSCCIAITSRVCIQKQINGNSYQKIFNNNERKKQWKMIDHWFIKSKQIIEQKKKRIIMTNIFWLKIKNNNFFLVKPTNLSSNEKNSHAFIHIKKNTLFKSNFGFSNEFVLRAWAAFRIEWFKIQLKWIDSFRWKFLFSLFLFFIVIVTSRSTFLPNSLLDHLH